jgi:hypothetical protein
LPEVLQPGNHIMRISVLFLVLLPLLVGSWAHGEEDYQQVKVADPYIDMHTGPGSGYPIVYVVERGQTIKIIKSHTDWYKIESPTGKVGWVSRDQLSQTLSPAGTDVELKQFTHQDFEQRHWEVGAMGGQLDDAPVLSLYGGYQFMPNFSAELTLSESLGNTSSSLSAKGSLLISPFPDWWLSPYFSLGTGVIQVSPNPTLIQPQDTTSQFSGVGIGIRTHISKRFILRMEYNDYVIFSASNDQDENEELGEWKIGFAVFF